MPAPTDDAYIDLVDDADRPVGLVRRRDVFGSHARFRVAHVFVFDTEGRLLLQQVGRTRRRSPLKWGSSVAGYLHAGESYEAAAHRRCREELALQVPLQHVGATRMADDGATKFIGLFTAVVNADQPTVVDPVHIEAIRFWALAELDLAIDASPTAFTETFHVVYRFYREHADRT